MKMILLPKQTITDVTSISFYELVHSVSNPVKTWIDLELCSGRKSKYRFMSLYVNSSRRKH